MSIQLHQRWFGAVLLLGCTLACSAADAQDLDSAVRAKLSASVGEMETICSDEIKQFCSGLTPGEGRTVLCLQAYEDKLGPKCTVAMHRTAHDAQRLVAALRDATGACRTDVSRLCAQIKAGNGRIIQCLVGNSSIAGICSEALQKLLDLAQK
ncbi:cysteine rich repeat-containing protein [Bradyrhizobium sp. USDA 4353]